jgi:hypothetical protein
MPMSLASQLLAGIEHVPAGDHEVVLELRVVGIESRGLRRHALRGLRRSTLGSCGVSGKCGAGDSGGCEKTAPGDAHGAPPGNQAGRGSREAHERQDANAVEAGEQNSGVARRDSNLRRLAGVNRSGSPLPKSRASVGRHGAPEGTRTPNLRLRRPSLYPLSYGRAAGEL